jgi:hypothetical protein
VVAARVDRQLTQQRSVFADDAGLLAGDEQAHVAKE